MARPKYTLETKLAVVNHYLSGHDGTQRTAQLFGVERTSVRRWIAAWKYHAIDGLSRQKEAYDAEFRLVVVQTTLNERLSMREAAARFNLSHENVVLKWVNTYKESGLHGLFNSQRGHSGQMTKKKISHPLTDKALDALTPEELRAELRYLRAENAYLKKLEALAQSEVKGKKPGPSSN